MGQICKTRIAYKILVQHGGRGTKVIVRNVPMNIKNRSMTKWIGKSKTVTLIRFDSKFKASILVLGL